MTYMVAYYGVDPEFNMESGVVKVSFHKNKRSAKAVAKEHNDSILKLEYTLSKAVGHNYSLDKYYALVNSYKGGNSYVLYKIL